jgi:hypothetical protein
MYAVRFFYFTIGGKIDVHPFFEQIHFFLLTFSTVCIAAGGNIINDYFDVKADKINRPEKLIVTKHISKRKAIIWHWTLNGIGFIIACYLSVFYQTFWYAFIHLISINVLWLYSVYFKRKFVLGNVLIASLTALVVLLSGFHFYHVCSYELHPILEAKITISESLNQAIIYWKNLFLCVCTQFRTRNCKRHGRCRRRQTITCTNHSNCIGKYGCEMDCTMYFKHSTSVLHFIFRASHCRPSIHPYSCYFTGIWCFVTYSDCSSIAAISANYT